MSNHNQLELLTSTQASLIDAALAARNLKVSELVKISWPSSDNPKVYSWWNCLADSAYTTNLTDWLGSTPLIPGFIATDKNKSERFHNIPRTSALSDDVVQMRFTNYGRVFESLCYKWRGGVRVEVFYFFPEIPDDALGKAYTVVSWFLGHLRKADSANDDFVNVTVRNGFRSPHVIVPSRIQGSNCQWYFGGDSTTLIPNNPCDYDKHTGGTRGTGVFTSCNHTLNQGTNNCIAIMGDSLSYGGDNYVTESSKIGYGEHQTISRTVGNEIRLDPLRVIYGKRHVKALQLKRYAKEYNPSEDHQDKGTIRTVFAVSEGPIRSITEVKVMDRNLPRTDGLGLETRLGTQQQTATTYSADMLNLNRTAHIRGDINPVDPNGILAADISGECVAEGRNTVRDYAADGTYTTGYTTERSSAMVELLTDDKQFGYRMDVERLELSDIVYLRALNSQFNADVQARTIQQVIEDICMAAVGGGSPGWFRPFVYNGKWRVLPILNTDLTLSDIPQIKSNFGSTRNVLYDRSRKVARIEPDYKDFDEIPNGYMVTIEDADHGNIERPITFHADLEQYKEGSRFGDNSKRRDPKSVAGFGLVTEAEARIMGEFLVKCGPFATGGLWNNCSLKFSICAVSSLGLNLHENKIVKLPVASNDRLNPYLDTDGNQFQYFLVTSLERTPRLELNVSLQAWSKPFWDTFCTEPAGNASGWVSWPAGEEDAIDGTHGVRTQIYSVSEDFGSRTTTYSSAIDISRVTLYWWRHTISVLPPTGKTYFVSYPEIPLGFLVWENGQVWVYSNSGVDFAVLLPPGSVQAGDTLTLEWDKNAGSPVRRYKHNGTTILTDSSPTVITGAFSGIGANATATGVYIGEIDWYVEYTGCVADYEVQGVNQSGGSVVAGTPGSGGGDEFDVLAYQMFDRPEDNLEVEVMS